MYKYVYACINNQPHNDDRLVTDDFIAVYTYMHSGDYSSKNPYIWKQSNHVVLKLQSVDSMSVLQRH